MKFLLMIWFVSFGFAAADCSSERPVLKGFTKQVHVFGVHIYASAATPDDFVLHAANVMAEYLDNNEDGIPDNQRVVDALVKQKVTLVMARNEEEMRSFNNNLYTTGPSPYQDLYVRETHPNGAAKEVFDATLEEVLHPITDMGYAGAYPEVFGVTPGTKVAKAMDISRGGHFEEVPRTYPENAWYSYYDKTCGYGCMITEYVYWALTSMLGAQDFPGRLEQIEDEWKLNTREKVKNRDPAVYKLLTDPRYKFPTVLPDGKYKGKTFKIREYPGRAEAPTEKEKIVSVVNQFFTVLETRDVKLAAKILMPEGSAFSTRKKENKPLIKYRTFKAIIESLPKSTEKYKEVMFNPTVLIDGDIAILWAKYKFYVNGRFSHGGVDIFSLVKTETGWKIAGIIYNITPLHGDRHK